MKIKCKKCGIIYDDSYYFCPNCGEKSNDVNYNYTKNISKPKTIEELKEWYIQKNLPDENVTRFFIGKNYST